ncbi:MAG: alpha/beta fold hydrolase [Acidimicrobiales bacterium]
MNTPTDKGYAPVNGLELYWESYGRGGTPLIVIHGGFGLIIMMSELIDTLASSRRIIAVELQGHGHTGDIDRPFTYEAFADDIAGLIKHLELGKVDLLGHSLGAYVALRTAIERPNLVDKVAVVSVPFRRDGWYPEVRAAFDHMGSASFSHLQQSPLYEGYCEVAPDPDAFPVLMDKTGELQRQPYDWSEDIRQLTTGVLLVFADADSIPASHIADFYSLLGGGQRDASWDGSGRPDAQLAILPGLTHYDIFGSALLVGVLEQFFGEAGDESS